MPKESWRFQFINSAKHITLVPSGIINRKEHRLRFSKASNNKKQYKRSAFRAILVSSSSTHILLLPETKDYTFNYYEERKRRGEGWEEEELTHNPEPSPTMSLTCQVANQPPKILCWPRPSHRHVRHLNVRHQAQPTEQQLRRIARALGCLHRCRREGQVWGPLGHQTQRHCGALLEETRLKGFIHRTGGWNYVYTSACCIDHISLSLSVSLSLSLSLSLSPSPSPCCC